LQSCSACGTGMLYASGSASSAAATS
jgi:hypothetical protein